MDVYTSDGQWSRHDGGKLNFDRDNLLITVNSGKSVAGWHWDQMACILQDACQEIGPGPVKTCRIALRFSTGQTQAVTIDRFHTAERRMAGSLIVFKGVRQIAIVNADFLETYTIEAAQ
jgi:hypothetical protein